MKLEAELTNPGFAEPALHDLQCSLLFRHEENRLVRCHAVRNDVRDRLRLTRPRRTMNHEVMTLHRVDEGAVLRCIRVLNQKRSERLDLRVIYRVIRRIAWKQSAISGVSGRIGPPQDRPHEGVINGIHSPIVWTQIRIDRKSTEREVAQDHPSMYLPSSEPRDGFSDALEIGFDRADPLLVAIFKYGEFAVKSYIGFEKLLKAEV